MAQFASVTWAGNPEVTTQKLQQMSNNDEWLKENLITGNLVFQKGELGQLGAGRSPSILVATKMVATNIPFDSQVPKEYYDVTIPYKVPFTIAPVVAYSVHHPSSGVIAHKLIESTRSDRCKVRLYSVNHPANIKFVGEINLIAVGK